jgi:GNAT superfamily N-acetyltransferase
VTNGSPVSKRFMLIRPLSSQNTPALMAFYNGLSRATIRTFRPLGDQASLEVCQRIVADNNLSPAPRFDLVACVGEEIFGWAFIEKLSTHPDLGIAVADSLQGQGIGTALLTRIVDWAREHSLPAIYLMVVQDNDRAIRLYERYGFVTYEEEFDEVDQLPYFHMVAHMH